MTTTNLPTGGTLTIDSQLKRKLTVVTDTDDLLQITPLGAGNEVGRSCIVVEYRGKTVMLDAGIHPAHEGIAGLPFYDAINPKDIDLVLITHFHLDHAASLPYFMEKTSFQGPVYMTHPTKAIYKWFLTDYVRVSTASVDDMLFDEQDLLRSYDKISVVDYRQEMDVDGIRFTPYNAGHVLGAAMFLIEIAGIKVLYTGDYSREEDRHLMAAERPAHVVPEVLICEATYGNQVHEPRLEREARFTSRVQAIVQRGGRCLIPVFALGRAQELLLILDEFWHNHPELDQVPIYFASSLAKKCMAVYQTYINMMNAHIRQQFSQSNPFIFKHISNLKHVNNFDDTGPCVMVASPGMLQNGLSRELFERWCTNPLNGLVLCGYSVEGTLARSLLASPESVTSLRGARLPLRMSVDYISFSAHVDFNQNSEFIDQVGAPNLVLVHGEPVPMGRLRLALSQKYLNPNEAVPADPDQPRRRRMAIYTPRNTETVKLPFRADKLAKTVGKLARVPPKQGSSLSGVLIGRDFDFRLMDASDLQDLAGLPIAAFHQRQMVPFPAQFSLIKTCLTCMFGSKGLNSTDPTRLEVLQAVSIIDVTSDSHPHVVLEWEGSESNDMVADGVLAAITSAITAPSSIKLTKGSHHHHSSPAQLTMELLKDHFDTVELLTPPGATSEVIRCDIDQFQFDIHPDTLTLITAPPATSSDPTPSPTASDKVPSGSYFHPLPSPTNPSLDTVPPVPSPPPQDPVVSPSPSADPHPPSQGSASAPVPLPSSDSPAYQAILTRLTTILHQLQATRHLH